MARLPRSLSMLGLLGMVVSAATFVACSSDDDATSPPASDAGTTDASVPVDGSPSGDDASPSVPTPPDPSTLATSCTTSADCQLIEVPVNCQKTVCDCPSVAVSSSAAASWANEVSTYKSACEAAAGDGGIVACGVDCVGVTPVCCGGTCRALADVPNPTCPVTADAGTDAGDADAGNTDAGGSDAGSSDGG